MKLREIILSFLARACVACVALSLVFYVFMEISYADFLDVTTGISFEQFLLLLLCSVCLSAASFLMLLRFPKAVNILLNYIVSFLAVFVIFNVAGKALNPLSAWILFSIFYALFWGIHFLFHLIFYPEKREEKKKEQRKKEAEYTSRF